ncbi:hypothetical protein GCM10010430_27190 [Kitasatospora cystarginea]|uniref:Blue (type 1) copper domain-containing protein n=1 Tax=Kitasatospora cystarginea TaxID=58350 RepID=A0ABN3DXT5_9ACTN
MTARHDLRLAVVGVLAALVLGIVTTLLLAAPGAFRGPASAGRMAKGPGCAPPSLPGHVVDVTAGDMGGMMGPHGRLPQDNTPRWHGMGMMWLRAHPGTVAVGTVSLRVFNAGALTHEVVVLPLPDGQAVGERPSGTDGRIDEASSLGEVSRSCGAGAGDGIISGATGWATLTLTPGRYELLCNLPGHYGAGMYTELDVTG